MQLKTGASLVLVLSLAAAANGLAAGPVSTGSVPETGLRYWEWNADGVLFRLTQRLPDQTRAYLLARGFDRATADHVATQCIFQSMFRNTAGKGGPTASIDLERWRVHANGGTGPLLTREYWQQVWRKRRISGAPAIAFEWSLLPTRQQYAPGDYNWGMTGYGLAPGTRFDLDFSWESDGKPMQGRLEGVTCADDIHPEPE